MNKSQLSINKNTRRNGTSVKNDYTSEKQRWQALQQRDAHADGQFVYAVATTGVFCRPTCPSKLAKLENIKFYDGPVQAEQAGFRPCKRCRPTDASQQERHAEAAAKACRLIETSDPLPTLDSLANAVGLSPFHFHRIFKREIGVTPRQYAAAQRTNRVRSELRSGRSVTQAIYGAGFNSSSRFYERSSDTLGMTPREFQKGGSGVTIQYAVVPCPLGLAMVAGTERGISFVGFGNERTMLEQELKKEFPKATLEKAAKSFHAWVNTIVDYIKHPRDEIKLPLDIRGTAFQQRVWQALREIPVGRTSTYTEVAAKIGRPAAVRAVARACATNPTCVIVPCHRVLRKGGNLSGYRWGLDRKRQLLKREGAL